MVKRDILDIICQQYMESTPMGPAEKEVFELKAKLLQRADKSTEDDLDSAIGEYANVMFIQGFQHGFRTIFQILIGCREYT